MNTEQPILIGSMLVPVSVTRFRALGFDGNKAGAGAKIFGIVAADTDSGQYAPVSVHGIVLVEAAEAFAVGAKLASDANGKAVAYVSGEVMGFAITAATGAGDIVQVRLE